MARDLKKYFKRSNYRKYEIRLDIKSITLCWVFNLAASGIVFLLSWFITSNVISTIFYTLSAWTITLNLSVIYWILWINKRLDERGAVKLGATTVVLVLYLIVMVIICTTFFQVLHISNFV